MLDYIKRSARSRSAPGAGWDTPAEADVATGIANQSFVQWLTRSGSPVQSVVLTGLLQGRTFREVAGALGCTSANVAYHIRLIRQRARQVMDEAG